MSRNKIEPRGARPPGQGGQGPSRPSLVPADRLPVWKAALQAALLLGIPLTLLLVARVIMQRFFPQLGY